MLYGIFVFMLIASCASLGLAFLPTTAQGANRRHPRFGSSNIVVIGSSTSSTTTSRLYGDIRVARQYVNQGMQSFRQGRVQESIDFFDKAEIEEPRLDPFLWQRGLSYYYANDFDKASQQFRRDVKVNPLDVEEIVWDIASQSQLDPEAGFPLTTALSLPRGESDRRPIMAVVYRLFRGQANEADLAKAGHASNRPSDEFYALLYLGLFAEAVRHDATKAENYLRQAMHTEYATSLGTRDYMTDVARIHCQLRGWGK